jgi:hypothetical protein
MNDLFNICRVIFSEFRCKKMSTYREYYETAEIYTFFHIYLHGSDYTTV